MGKVKESIAYKIYKVYLCGDGEPVELYSSYDRHAALIFATGFTKANTLRGGLYLEVVQI